MRDRGLSSIERLALPDVAVALRCACQLHASKPSKAAALVVLTCLGSRGSRFRPCFGLVYYIKEVVYDSDDSS